MPKGASIVSGLFLFVHFTQCAPTLDSPGQALAITGSWFHQLPVEALLKVRACLHPDENNISRHRWRVAWWCRCLACWRETTSCVWAPCAARLFFSPRCGPEPPPVVRDSKRLILTGSCTPRLVQDDSLWPPLARRRIFYR